MHREPNGLRAHNAAVAVDDGDDDDEVLVGRWPRYPSWERKRIWKEGRLWRERERESPFPLMEWDWKDSGSWRKKQKNILGEYEELPCLYGMCGLWSYIIRLIRLGTKHL